MAVANKVKTKTKAKSPPVKAGGGSASSGPLTLPAGKSTPCTQLDDYTLLLFGARKIGKTSFFSHFEDPFFLMFEPGGRALSIKQAAVHTWEEFLAYIELLEKNPDYCKTVIIDTGYMAYERCFEYTTKKLGLTDIRDASWGTGWKAIDKAFRDAHFRLFNTGLGFGVTAHTEITEVNERSGRTYHKFTSQLGKQATRLYASIVDIIAYYQYDNAGDRILTIRGSDSVEAGTRIEDHFMYKGTSDPIMHIDVEGSSKYAYEQFVKAFDNKIEGGKKKKKKIEV